MDTTIEGCDRENHSKLGNQIFTLTWDCEDLFNTCSDNVDKAQSLLVETLEDFKQRFKAWWGYLGVFADERVNLDRRLRNQPGIQDVVIRLLLILKRNLTLLRDCARSNEQSHSISSDIIALVSQEGGSNTKELSPLISLSTGAIEDTLLELNRVGIAVRQSKANETTRARRWVSQHLDLSRFETLVSLILETLYSNAPATLLTQLRESMVDRYARLLVRNERRNILGKDIRDQTTSPIIASTSIGSHTHTYQVETNIGTTGGPLPMLPEKNKTSAPISMAPSSIDERRFQVRLSNVQASSLRPGTTVKLTNTREPPVPDFAGKRTTMCQWCFTTIKDNLIEEHNSKVRWTSLGKKHYCGDLEPYVCVSEECAETVAIFATFESWRDHMSTHHSNWTQCIHSQRIWRCNINEIANPGDFSIDDTHDSNTLFPSLDHFRSHIRVVHQQLLSRSSSADETIESLASNSAFEGSRDSNVCPICQSSLENMKITDPSSKTSTGIMDNHIAQHLENLMVLSLRIMDIQRYPELDDTVTGDCGPSSDSGHADFLTNDSTIYSNRLGSTTLSFKTPAQSVYEYEHSPPIGSTASSFNVPNSSNKHSSAHGMRYALRHEKCYDRGNKFRLDNRNASSLPPGFAIQKNPSLEETCDLYEALWDSKISCSPNETNIFIPFDKLDLVKVPRLVEGILQNCKIPEKYVSLFLEAICTDESSAGGCTFFRIFAILVLCNRPRCIGKFIELAIDDSYLPLPKLERKGGNIICSPLQHNHRRQLSQDQLDILFEDRNDWTQHDLHSFSTYQYWTIAPFFTRPDHIIPHYVLEANDMMPFTEKKSKTELEIKSMDQDIMDLMLQGGFGDVVIVKLHPSHYSFYNQPYIDDTHSFALKCVKSRNRDEFQSEVNALRKYNYGIDEHLIPLLATIERDDGIGKFYMLFPKANGDLRYFWETEFSLSSDHSLQVPWMAKQCIGITMALSILHNDQDRENGQDFPIYGRHGDVKARNILWFAKPGVSGPNGWCLVLSDFGLTTFHRAVSISAQTASKLNRTVTYQAPEFELRGKKVSRKSDIWALGCTYLDFITCYIEGYKAVDQEFPSLRGELDKDQISEDKFYRISDDNLRAELKPSVKDWIVRLRKHKRCSPYLNEFLTLIEKRMLHIDLEHRPTASEVVDTLHRLSVML